MTLLKADLIIGNSLDLDITVVLEQNCCGCTVHSAPYVLKKNSTTTIATGNHRFSNLHVKIADNDETRSFCIQTNGRYRMIEIDKHPCLAGMNSEIYEQPNNYQAGYACPCASCLQTCDTYCLSWLWNNCLFGFGSAGYESIPDEQLPSPTKRTYSRGEPSSRGISPTHVAEIQRAASQEEEN